MIKATPQTIDKLSYWIKKDVGLKTISKVLGITEQQTAAIISALSFDGIKYIISGDSIIPLSKISESSIFNVPIKGKSAKILAISDTHLGCNQDRIDILNYLYEQAEKNNVDFIIHCGDLVDGVSTFPDHIENLRLSTFEEQKEYVIEEYPKSYLKTYIVAGNHDLWWQKKCQRDIIDEITTYRPDLVYLGGSEGILTVNDMKLLLFHGHKKSKKLYNKFEEIGADLSFRGHSHCHDLLYITPIPTIQIPCIVDERKHPNCESPHSEKGAWWLEIQKEEDNLIIKKELEEFPTRKLIRTR